MAINNNELQKGLIITDNFSKYPILDFIAYSNALVKVIKNSYPNFTIGILGKWGTGKTTLMKSIEEKLKDSKESIIPVWFDAWKYENEKDLALIPLLKVINYSVREDGDERKKKLKDALKEAAIFTLGVSSELVTAIVSNYAGKEAGGLLKRGLAGVTGKLIPQLKELRKLSDIDRNSVFYNGIKNIQDAIYELQKAKPDFRIVIFIDDLDRCSEDKILQILESIKVFLSLNGIIYVLGISYDRVVELINKKYQTNTGEQYLKKFIQIPITLTEWNYNEIVDLIEYFVENDIIHNDYKEFVRDHKGTIASAIEENPRETKRFLNNLIISYEVFVSTQNLEEGERELFLNQLLLVQIINSRWRDLYIEIMNSKGRFLEKLIPLVPEELRKKLSLDSDVGLDQDVKFILVKYGSDKKLWEFLDKKNLDILKRVKNWNDFRRALKTVDISESEKIRTESKRKSALHLLGSIIDLINDINEIKSAPLNAMLEMLYQTVGLSMADIDKDPESIFDRILPLKGQLVRVGDYVAKNSSRNDLVVRIQGVLSEIKHFERVIVLRKLEE